MTRVAVIGAGAAGLVSAHEILRAGFEVCVFEASPQVGGIWCYTPETDDDLSGRNPGESVWSSVYSSLRTNLPRDVMAFMDYTFDSAGGGKDDWPRFPHHSLVLEYLQQFARDFDITSHIRFETEVTRVAPQDGRWTVETHSKAGASEETFDAVMVCNGHYAKPRVPSLPGIDQFEGRIWHSHNYRTPEAFEGRRVALWGTSASGADISLELSQVADVTWCGNAFSGAEPGKVIRGMKVYPSPTCITREGRLEFADGSFSEPVDDFMFCTGYEYSFPFLDDDVIHVDDNRVHPLYQQLIPPSHPTLAFIGIPFLIIPFSLFQMQARWFAALLAGKVELPSSQEMLEQVDAEHAKRRDEGLLDRHTHKLGEQQTDYYNLLAAQCLDPPLPDWFGDIANFAQRARFDDPVGFRDAAFPAPGPTVVL